MKYTLQVIVLLLLCGCAAQKYPDVTIPRGAKVGVIVKAVSNEIVHTHIGGLKIQNIKKSYSVPIVYRDFINNEISQDLTDLGYFYDNIIENSPEGQRLLESYEVSGWDGRITITQEGITNFSRIYEESGIEVILVVEPGNGGVKTETGNWGGNGIGFLTTTYIDVQSSPHAFLRLTAFSTKNPVVFGHTWNYKSPDAEFLGYPKNLENISSSEIESINSGIEKEISEFLKYSIESMFEVNRVDSHPRIHRI